MMKDGSKKSYPDGVDELYCRVFGVVKDPDRIKYLYDLFAAVLSELCKLESVEK